MYAWRTSAGVYPSVAGSNGGGGAAGTADDNSSRDSISSATALLMGTEFLVRYPWCLVIVALLDSRTESRRGSRLAAIIHIFMGEFTFSQNLRGGAGVRTVKGFSRKSPRA